MKKYTQLIAIILFALFFFTSCNGKLTRGEAAKIIQRKNFSRYRETRELIQSQKVFAINYLVGGPGGISGHNPIPPSTQAVIDRAQAKGLLTTSDQFNTQYGTVNTRMKESEDTTRYINLTNEGRKYLEGYDGNLYRLRLFDYGFGGVTGIHELSKTEVQVDYVLTAIYITPFAEAFGANVSRKIPMHEIFIKYDNGWRMQ